MTRCPEALYGQHGTADASGRCPYCGEQYEAPARRGADPSKRTQARRASDPLSIDGPDEGDYLDGWG